MIFLLDATFLAMIALTSMQASATEAAVRYTQQDATKLHMRHCNNTRNSPMWGDPDPNIFYICDEESNATRQLHCPVGHGFFNGQDYYGCMPFGKWPACIDSSSSSTITSGGRENGSDTLQACSDEENLQQTWTAVDPNKFYMCQQKNAAPLLVNCEPGKGYVSTWVSVGAGGKENIHIVGCAAWEKWRMYMHCDAFY